MPDDNFSKSMGALIRPQYPPLEAVTSPNVPTEQAAYYLGRKGQTLRIWATGKAPAPILPLRIGGRLAWPTARLRELCGVN